MAFLHTVLVAIEASPFDPDPFWNLFLQVCGWIALVVTAIKGVQFIFSFTPTSKLEKKVEDNRKHINDDFEHLKALDSKVNVLEEDIKASKEADLRINESLSRIAKAQISLLRHFVTGNGQAEMNKEATDLTEYFIDHK